MIREKTMHLHRIAVLAVCLILCAASLTGCEKDFDAQGYVQAVLDQLFQGEVDGAAGIMEDVTKEELREQYEQALAGFVDNNIISGMDVSDAMRADYIEVCRRIFRSMRYNVQSAEKVSKTEYKVSVEISPADVFSRFVEGVKQDSEEILQKARNGEYSGTEEEISAQMQSEFLWHSYELLSTYSEEITYGDKTTVTLRVTAGEDKQFSIDEEELEELKIKILRLDEIQD
ncbi:MAG TPA: hypothetical protein DCZ20_09545 [Lachnospiraceae bacterium]|nr:hypothetical protein [Lachnospiraceae bacterium]